MVAQRLADLEDGAELVLADAPDASTAVCSTRNLIQVAPDRTQLADGTFKRYEFLLRQGGQGSQVGPHEHGHVRRRCHPARGSSLVEQQAILWPEPDVQTRTGRAFIRAASADIGSRRLTTMPRPYRGLDGPQLS